MTDPTDPSRTSVLDRRTLIERTGAGVAAYHVPDEQFPTEYVYESPRLIVPGMGEHVYNRNTPEVRPGGEFTHTYIYGVYDWGIDLDDPTGTVDLPLGPGGEVVSVPTYAGDTLGELTFTEPMITETFLRSLTSGATRRVKVPVETPEAFPRAGYYPTAYTMRYSRRRDVFRVSITDMERFDAARA